ncbi:alpha/beta fold hydrolase [Streptomyces sp. NPDC054933]
MSRPATGRRTLGCAWVGCDERSKTPFDTPEDAQLWRDAHQQFVKAAPNRRLVVAERSSHDIPIDRPDVVVSAVDDMVKMVDCTAKTHC